MFSDTTSLHASGEQDVAVLAGIWCLICNFFSDRFSLDDFD